MCFDRIKPFESVSNNYWCATIGHVANDEKTGKVYAKGWKCRCGSLVHCRAPPGKKLGLISKRRTSRLHGRTSTATATASEAADKPGERDFNPFYIHLLYTLCVEHATSLYGYPI